MHYKQCLAVIDNHTQVIKELNTKYSELEVKFEAEKRADKMVIVNLEGKIKKLEREKSCFNNNLRELA